MVLALRIYGGTSNEWNLRPIPFTISNLREFNRYITNARSNGSFWLVAITHNLLCTVI